MIGKTAWQLTVERDRRHGGTAATCRDRALEKRRPEPRVDRGGGRRAVGCAVERQPDLLGDRERGGHVGG